MAPIRNRSLYQLKVTLPAVSPAIWRQIQVWEHYHLAQLHRVLQIVMGWENCHLYEFQIDGKTYGDSDLNDEAELGMLDTKQARIGAVVQDVGVEFEYVYDLGDNWRHTLLLEAIVPPNPGTVYPRCLGGERRCPPEDVGGATGYANYLEAMADPNHDQHEECVKWRGPFDPEAFSVEKVNQQIERKFRPSRKR